MIQFVDRSHLNSPVSLASLKAKGIAGCWFKATQGLTYQDPTFNASWQEAKAPGFMRGAYHFFNPQVNGVEQAKNFLSRGVNFSGVGCLPPCVDVEDLVGSNAADTVQLNEWVSNNWQTALNELIAFLSYVKQETGRDCIIYSYNNYMREYYHSHPFPDNDFWLSSLQPTCPVRYDNGKPPLFWQYSYNWKGTDMDADYFTGTIEQLNQLANITTT